MQKIPSQDEKSPTKAATIVFSTPETTRNRRSSGASLTRSLSMRSESSHLSLLELLDQETLTHCSESLCESPINNTKCKANEVKDIFAHVIKYDGYETSHEYVAAYIIKYEPSFYVRLHETCMQLASVAISYRAQNNPRRPSQRRGSLLGTDNKPLATGKYPPLSSKTNPDYVLGKGHIMRDPYLQFVKASPIDNNVPGAFPFDVTKVQPNKELTTKYQKYISADIKNVYIYNQLVCWEEAVTQQIEEKGNILAKDKKNSKYLIQEAERLYSIIHNIKAGNYKFVSADHTQLCFLFNQHLFKIKIDNLICNTDLQKSNLQQVINCEEKIDGFASFDDYVHHHQLQDLHAPIWEVLDSGIEKPSMCWCGSHGHITGDNDPQHFAIPMSMPRLAYYGIFNGKTAEPGKFLNGLNLLLARLRSTNKQSFKAYLSQCKFDIHEYLHPSEIIYLCHPNSIFINYLQPDNKEFSFYINFIQQLEETIAKYEKNPHLLKLIGEADLFTLVMQHAINHPMSYHGAEDLNICAGEFGVTLNCFPATKYSDTPFFTITENEESYLALLFSDPGILKHCLFGVNQRWLNHENPLLNEYWLDLIEIQALHFAAISDFEFEMYRQMILKRIDRRYPGEDMPRLQTQNAMNKVIARLDYAKQYGYTQNPTNIQKRIFELYKKHEVDIKQMQESIARGLYEIDEEERHMQLSKSTNCLKLTS